MKKIFIMLFCGLSILTLSGCQNSSSATISSPSNLHMQVVAGSNFVIQNFAFPTGAKALIKNGEEQEKVETYISQLKNELRVKVWNKMYLNYFSIYSSKPDNNYVIGGSQVDFKQAKYNSKTDRIEFSFNFNSYAAWNYYHPKTGDEDAVKQDNLFLNIDESKGEFPFSQKVGDKSVGQMYVDIIDGVLTNNFSQEKIDALDEITFSYDYVTTHKRIHSNADEKINDGRYYHHIWSLKHRQLGQGKSVEIKTVCAVRGWWYLIALGSALAAVGIGSLTIFISTKIKSKKSNKKEA